MRQLTKFRWRDSYQWYGMCRHCYFEVFQNTIKYEFQFPPNGKARENLLPMFWTNERQKESFDSVRTGKGLSRMHLSSFGFMGILLCFDSLWSGKCFARYSIFAPDAPWLRRPPNQMPTAGRIFFVKVYPKNPRNADKHWNGRDFLSKVPRKSGSIYVLGRFQGCLHPVCASRLCL